MKVLGNLLYTDYLLPFELAGVILLVAMVAAIGLTFRGPSNQKSQKPAEQIRITKQDRLTCAQNAISQRRSIMIGLSHYLTLAAILFSIGVAGIYINRKNVIILLMCIELILLAVNTNFVAFSHFLQNQAGEVFVFFILTVAAAESAIGLAILVILFRKRRTINVEALDSLKG